MPLAVATRPVQFFRTVDLPGSQLDTAVTRLCEGCAGRLAVGHDLELEPLTSGVRGGWAAQGNLRRATRWYWVPVLVELWTVHDHLAVVTMTPRRRVHRSEGYFRLGSAALTTLAARLTDASVESASAA
jgi:hypothetical protein